MYEDKPPIPLWYGLLLFAISMIFTAALLMEICVRFFYP